MSFENKIVVVLSGGSGIGAAATRAFAEAGARVAFTYFSSGENAEALEGALSGSKAYKLDATNSADVDGFFAQVAADLGPVDVLFANSGGLLQRCRIVDFTDKLWEEVMAVNLNSTFYACRAALRIMEPRKSGAIVTMSSLAGFDGGGHGASAYGASKGAVATLTRALAKEVGPLGIRVNGVAPGLIGTRFHDTFNTPEGRAAAVERTPLRREGTPHDVAAAVLYLASPASSFITGEIIQINGGTGF